MQEQQQKLINLNRKKITPETKISLLFLLSCLSMTSSSILMALETSVCHIVYPFVPSTWLTTAHCNESLVWFKASGFWYRNLPGSSPELFLNVPCLWDLMGIIVQDPSWDPEGPRWGSARGQPKAQLWSWVLARHVRLSHWDLLPWVRRVSSPTCMSSGYVYPSVWWGGGSLFPGVQGSAPLLCCRGKASFPRA